jgi:hypothetical protein
MTTELLNTEPPAPERPPHYIKCDCCECGLTPNGQVFTVSEKAREMRDYKEKTVKQIEVLTAERDSYKSQFEEISRELHKLKNPEQSAVVPKKNYFSL